jgi:hypothetical protein
LTVSISLKIRDGFATQIIATPSSPIPQKKLAEILEELQKLLEDSSFSPFLQGPSHEHTFQDFPFYSFGEIISIIRKCSDCGFVARDSA